MSDVDKMLGTAAPAQPAPRRSSSRRPAAAATPVAETASDAKPTRKRRPMTAEEKKAVSERMKASWAAAQKESREVARYPPPAALRISFLHGISLRPGLFLGPKKGGVTRGDTLARAL